MSSSNVQSIDLPTDMPGLTVLDDETTEWLLNTCPEIYSAAKQWIKELAQTKEEVNRISIKTLGNLANIDL